MGYYNVGRNKRIEARNIEGITIENNTILDSMMTGITLSHVKGAIIKNNRILGSGAREPVKNGSGLPGSAVYGEMPHGAIFLNNVSDVNIFGNEIEEERYSKEKIVESRMYENENVSEQKN